jgi:hypothetical protein
MNSFFKLKNLRERFYPEKDLIKILLRSVVYLAGVGSAGVSAGDARVGRIFRTTAREA